MLAEHLRRLLPVSVKRAATDRDFWFRARVNLLTKPMYSGLGSIMALHRVCPASERPRLGFNRDLEITPELLDRTIEFFKIKGYEFVSLDRIHEILKAGGTEKRFVAFTLDDGYIDNLTHALPVFKKHNVPFAVYVANCFPNRTAILWWYVLEDLLWDRNEIQVELNGKKVSYDCSTSQKKDGVFELLAGQLTFMSVEQQQTFLRDYSGDLLEYVNKLALTWEQVSMLNEEPLVTIGAHSSNHVALACASPDEAYEEICSSKLQIESEIGRRVDHFAYPFGGRRAAGKREFELVKRCGFKTATTTRDGNIFSSHRNHLECLPRIPISSADLNKDVSYLNLWVDGLIPCHENGFQRVVTA
jgi:peptidoglycan/xylan/chitin deacetylase (PgdA/CDA1 family)